MHYKRLICMGVSLLITIGVQGISIAADSYDPYKTASYASKYAVNHNSNYKYFSGSDCTNFISQSAKAGGQAMDMNKWYPFITTPEFSISFLSVNCKFFRVFCDFFLGRIILRLSIFKEFYVITKLFVQILKIILKSLQLL